MENILTDWFCSPLQTVLECFKDIQNENECSQETAGAGTGRRKEWTFFDAAIHVLKPFLAPA